MIYTSYFGNLRKINKHNTIMLMTGKGPFRRLSPISIALYSPRWYDGCEYKKLAPTRSIFENWKRTHNVEFYIKKFHEDVLAKLNPKEVAHELLERISPNTIPCLLCYEKDGEFCHRTLVSDWFSNAGITCIEFGLEKSIYS